MMEYFEFSDTETPSSTHSASTASPSYITDSLPTGSNFLKVPGNDLYIRPASHISTPQFTDNSSPHTSPDFEQDIYPTSESSKGSTSERKLSYRQTTNSHYSSSDRPAWFSSPGPKEYLDMPKPDMSNISPVSLEKGQEV